MVTMIMDKWKRMVEFERFHRFFVMLRSILVVRRELNELEELRICLVVGEKTDVIDEITGLRGRHPHHEQHRFDPQGRPRVNNLWLD